MSATVTTNARELTADAAPDLQAVLDTLAAYADELVGVIRGLNTLVERQRQELSHSPLTTTRPAPARSTAREQAEEIADLTAELDELREESADALYLAKRTVHTMSRGAYAFRRQIESDRVRAVERLLAYRGAASVRGVLGLDQAGLKEVLAGQRAVSEERWQQVVWLLLECVLTEPPVLESKPREGQGQ